MNVFFQPNYNYFDHPFLLFYNEALFQTNLYLTYEIIAAEQNAYLLQSIRYETQNEITQMNSVMKTSKRQ